MKRLWTLALAAGLLIEVSPLVLRAQSEVACGAAVTQLQGYVQEVNRIAQFEYYQGIPSRCGYNGYCAQTLVQQLSAWYAQQSSLVNQWYAVIARQCSTSRTPTRTRQTDVKAKLDDVDDLEVDDEDKTVKIRIPSKPSGYSSRGRQ